MEKLRVALRAAPNPLAGHLQIADVHGINPAHFVRSWSIFAELSQTGQDNYPAFLGCCCVVRAPEAG
eukprot:5291669-Prymnesium_polylepis.1